MAPNSPLTFTESAILDLEEIDYYYHEQQVPDIGKQFMREIISRCEKLPAYPEHGRIVPEFNQPLLRELIHPPFRIVYRLGSTKITIIRIWRSERLLKLPQEE